MRKIGSIDNQEHGNQFVDYLFGCGIRARLDAETDGMPTLWVEDEDRVDEARGLLDAYLCDPDAQRYRDAAVKAEKQRQEEKRAQAAFSRRVFDRQRISRRAAWSAIPVTRILILLSVAATLFGGLGSDSDLTQWLSITGYEFLDGRLLFRPGLPEIFRGQVWRLLTPVFLHASLMDRGLGLLHILFNMLWLMDLGGMLERVQGGRALLIKVVVIGVLSNLLQYYIGGPAFGGMSGVVFGLLGYSWVRGRQDLTSGLYVQPQIMFMMTFWFFLGFSGMMGSIANAAHGGGLATGLLWGYISANGMRIRRS